MTQMQEHCFAIPAYKDSDFLETCVKSVLEQTVKTSVIICTSSPTEKSRAIAEKYQIPYFVNPQTGKGIANDWNFALEQANAKLVTIAHQDDVYCPGFAAAVLHSMDANSQISFTNYSDIHGSTIKTGTINNIVKTLLLFPFLFKAKIATNFFKKLILSFGDPICCPAVTINKSLLPNFRFSETYQCVLDWHAWYQLAEQPGNFVFINQRLMHHRVHQASETTNQIKQGKRKAEETSMLTQIWGNFIGKFIAQIYQLGQLENNVK